MRAGGAVEEAKLGDAAVTTAKLADGAVTGTKLGPNAVTGAAALASLSVSVDPPPGSDCSRDTVAVTGATAADHVVVTLPAFVEDIIASGDAGDDEIGVRLCNEGGIDYAPTDVNVLVIAG